MKSQNHIYKTGIINVNTMNKSSGKKKKVWIHSSHLIREREALFQRNIEDWKTCAVRQLDSVRSGSR